MLQTTTMPLSKGSLHSCTFKRIPDETRFHVVDPNVIQKVESSGKYILTYKEPDTTYLNIHELRKEMGSPNLDLCTEEIEEIPYLVYSWWRVYWGQHFGLTKSMPFSC